MKITQGNLPENVIYFAKRPTKVTFSWDDDEDGKPTEVGTVRAIYISDAANKKTQETGRTWAGVGHTKVERANTPFKIRILNLEHRSKGGRAYKCVADDLYFDLREDVLMDVIRHCTITKGAPDCDFVWGKVKSEMKIVRVGSELHTALINANAMNATAKVDISDLKVGDRLQAKSGAIGIFLGFVDNIKATTEQVPPEPHAVYGYNRSEDDRITAITPQKNIMAWFEVNDYEKQKSFSTLFQDKPKEDWDPGLWHVQFKKSHSYKIKLGQDKIPDDIFDQIQKRALADCVRPETHRGPRVKLTKQAIASSYEKLTVHPTGTPPVQLPPNYAIAVGDRWNRYGR